MLLLPTPLLEKITVHARRSYPLECCGLLLGTPGPRKNVLEIAEARNLQTERAADRYLLDPADQLKAEKRARTMGWDVLGFYHSHPDHPAAPSATDLDLSWEGYSYLILSVANGEPGAPSAWVLDGQRRFQPEPLNLL